MSRTDKDQPWWVRSELMVPSHSVSCEHRIPRYHPADHTCDLSPEPPARTKPNGPKPRMFRKEHCTWEPEWPWKRRYKYTRPPFKRERHLDWWGPARARDRDAVIKARQEYHGCGQVDEPKVMPQHRHASIKGWWD